VLDEASPCGLKPKVFAVAVGAAAEGWAHP